MIICTQYALPPVIYVAGPYRAETPEAFDANLARARRAGILAVEKGWAPMIPHLNTAGFDKIKPEIGDAFWLASATALMLRCDCLLMLDGWERSEGSIAEHKLAQHQRLPVFYSAQDVPVAKNWAQYLLAVQRSA